MLGVYNLFVTQRQMFQTVCSYPLPSDLFAQAIHPREPLIAVGLASGHVQTFRLPVLSPASPSTNSETSALSNGCGTIDTIWKTKRHNGSCRSVSYSFDGAHLFSAGTDGLVKMADSQSGKVVSKIAVPTSSTSGKQDLPALIYALTPQTVILGTDSAAVHIYDLREKMEALSSRPASSFYPHEDYISSITPLPPSETSTSGFPKQWVSTGGTTLAVTDVRKGVIARSEDQEEELLSSCFVSGLPKRGKSVGAKVLVGGAGGVLTLWEKGVWDDQDERITVDSGRGGGESLDVLSNVPETLGRHLVAVGLGSGTVRIVELGANKVVAEARHDDLEGVIALGFEAEGRMISGGGQIVKVWQQEMDPAEEEIEPPGKRQRASSSDEDSREDSDSSEEEPQQRQRKKKKRKKSISRQNTKQNGVLFGDLD